MKKWIFVLILVPVLLGCNGVKEPAEECMRVSFTGDTAPAERFFEQVDKIRLIPLGTGPEVLIGASDNLVAGENDFFIIKNIFMGQEIFRFGGDGKFLNRVGARGRGPGEYTEIYNMQIVGDTVMVYSSPGFTVKCYDRAGKFLKETEYGAASGGQGYKYGENFLNYNGFDRQDRHRVFLMDEKRNITEKYLYTSGNVLSVGEATGVFNPYGKNVYIREAFCDTVYCFSPSGKKMQPYISFDFGPYSLGKDFLNDGGDPMAKMEKVMSRPFATTVRYLENDKIRMLEMLVNAREEKSARFLYAVDFKNRPGWEWYEFGPDAVAGLSGIFRTTGKNSLYCLIDPSKLEFLKENADAKIENPEALQRTGENDNPVIAVLSFK